MLKVKTHFDHDHENLYPSKLKVSYNNLSFFEESLKRELSPSSQFQENWLLQKQLRLNALLNTTRYIWKYQGVLPVIKQTFRFIKGERSNFKIEIAQTISPPLEDGKTIKTYQKWISANEPDGLAVATQRKYQKQLSYRPLITIFLEITDAREKFLQETIESIINQTYSNWELLLVDYSQDNNVRHFLEKVSQKQTRIKLVRCTSASKAFEVNTLLNKSKGEFLMRVLPEDTLSCNALFENVFLLNEFADTDIIYSDEDKIDSQNLRSAPFFKPEWSPDLFLSTRYFSQGTLLRKTLFNAIGGFGRFSGNVKDFDLLLRLSERTNKISHISKILYHKRQNDFSNRVCEKEELVEAISEHLNRINTESKIELTDHEVIRIRRRILNNPKVSIIIPTCDKVDFLARCVKSIEEKSTYKNFEIIIVDNNSVEVRTKKFLERVSKKKNVKVLEFAHSFNFSAINNFAADFADGELLLFLNNDTEIISSDWLESMIEHALRAEVGAVGAKLLYPNGNIQHAGVILGVGGIAGHSHKHFSRYSSGYFNRINAVQNLSAVTGACMMIKAQLFKDVEGFDAQNVAIAYNDIDLCLRLREKNLLIVYTPYAELTHHESLSRGLDYCEEKMRRLQKEAFYMISKWKNQLLSDPYYSPHLTLEKEDFSIKIGQSFAAR